MIETTSYRSKLLLSSFIAVGCFSSCSIQAPPKLPPTELAWYPTLAPKDTSAESEGFVREIEAGLAHGKQADHQKALEAFTRASAINPKSGLAYGNICAAYIGLKRWRNAVDECRKALELDASLLFAKRALEFAATSLKNGMNAMLTDIAAGREADLNRVNLGLEYYHQKDFERAIAVWMQVPRNSPHFAMAQNNLATAYIVTRQFDKAQKALKQALRLDPKNQIYRNNQAWLESARKGG